MSVAVLGAGAFGTALAISLASTGPIILCARDLGDMYAHRENSKRLPDCPFPKNLSVTDQISDTALCDTLLLAVPMQSLHDFVKTHHNALQGKQLVACCKGIDLRRGIGPLSILEMAIPSGTPALLTGPSFAADIARGLPTALTLACKDDVVGKALQKTLTTKNLRLYRTTDTIGTELGGALKNVIAIASGAAIGAGLGESARAAVMTRGFAEIQRLAAYQNADPKTLMGLSGFGDLTLTCTSTQSRNYRLGLSIGQGVSFDPSTTIEGAATAQAVHELAQKLGLDMPITSAVAGLLSGRLDVATAMRDLLARPLKEE